MASGKGNYLSNQLLETVFNNSAYVPPANCDVALYTAVPNAAGGGTEVSTTGTAYARQSYPMASWTAAASQSVSNTAQISWATATANWGTVVAVALFEAGTSNLLYWGNLTTNRVVNTGDSVRFAIGGLVVSES